MNTARSEFFDSRDKYLSFVHTTDEKIRIAFYLGKQLRRAPTDKNAPFYLLDAGTGEGTVVATFLTALHKRMPDNPIIATGKEISIDDIIILLSYLPDRFAEHESLVVHLTNLTYQEMNNLSAAEFTHLKKGIRGDTSHDFGLQLMNMTDCIKKHWALDACEGKLMPRSKVILTLYRTDQKQRLRPFLANLRAQPPAYDFIIASQSFRLRRAPEQVARFVIAPLLKLLKAGGCMVLVYSSGCDFSKPLLRSLYPDIKPYINTAPQKLLTALKKIPDLSGVRSCVDQLRYGFINLYLGRQEFSLGNLLSLWKAIIYVGQLSDAETNAVPFGEQLEKKMQHQLAKTKDLSFVNNVITFRKSRRRARL